MMLSGLKVLLTRPVGQNKALADDLLAAGACVSEYAVLEITALDPKRDRDIIQRSEQVLADLDRFRHVIFVSGNAARYGCDWIEHYWPQYPAGIQWHAVGETTARLLRERQLLAVAPDGAMNSEALLAQPALQQLAGQRVLIVRGVDGREYLAEQLRARGAEVSYAECYRRTLPASTEGELAALIRQQQIALVCIHSGESLNNFARLLGPQAAKAFKSLALVVPGQRVKELALASGFTDVSAARTATRTAMFEAVKLRAANME